MEQRDDILFAAGVSSRYHRRRAAFLELISTLMTLTVLVGGAGAFLSLIGGDGTKVAKAATFIVTLVGIAQALFRVDTCAVQHRVWLRRWNRLLGDAKIDEKPSADVIAAWTRERYEIETDCVQEMRALVNDCYNKTMREFGWNGEAYDIRWWHRLFIEVLPFENSFSPPGPRRWWQFWRPRPAAS